MGGFGKLSAFDWLSQLGYVVFEFTLQITFGAETVYYLIDYEKNHDRHRNQDHRQQEDPNHDVKYARILSSSAWVLVGRIHVLC